MAARPTPDASAEPAARPNVAWLHGASNLVRALLAFEAITFLVAAILHYGAGDFTAMTAETIIGTVLLAGLGFTWLRPSALRAAAVGVQAFALLGTLVGIRFTIIVGLGTVPEIVYHIAIALILVLGIAFASRVRSSRAA